MHPEPTAVPVPDGAGVACSTARLPRIREGTPVPVLAEGYAETEYLLSGSARTYTGAVGGPIAVVTTDNPYTTRILARYPMDPSDFTGRVVVEPFNGSFGVERDALWAHVGDMLQSHGDAWIGITERAMGAAELKKLEPARYGAINFRFNDLAWDVLRDIGALIKTGGSGSPLGHLAVRRVYLGGYSQSAVDAATFATAFHAAARTADGSAIYDGYFPAAHAASLAAISSGDARRPPMEQSPMRDIDVPVIEVQPQSDVEGFFAPLGTANLVNPGSASVRRADSDFKFGRYRLYEVAGAPHLPQLDGCGGPGSTFPTGVFVRAALRLLFAWVEDAVPPPRAARISMNEVGPVSEARVDRFGNCLGGLRSPHLDVPLARYEAHSTPGPACQLVGRETPLQTRTLLARYRDAREYLNEFTTVLDATIAAGFILPADREPILQDMSNKAQEAFQTTDDQEVLIP